MVCGARSAPEATVRGGRTTAAGGARSLPRHGGRGLGDARPAPDRGAGALEVLEVAHDLLRLGEHPRVREDRAQEQVGEAQRVAREPRVLADGLVDELEIA